MNDGDKDLIIDMIREDLREVKKDVKLLLSFKWKIIGGSVVLSTIVSIAIGLITKVKS